MRIIVDVPDLQPGRASSTYVASYVRATLKLHALRRELAQAVLDVVRCSKALASRREASKLLAEAQGAWRRSRRSMRRPRPIPPPIHGGQDLAASPASIRTRLLGLIDCGALPAVMPRRMFILAHAVRPIPAQRAEWILGRALRSSSGLTPAI